MNKTRFGAFLGLALGAVWAFGGFDAAALSGVLCALGAVIGMVLEGRIDLAEYLGHQHDGGQTRR